MPLISRQSTSEETLSIANTDPHAHSFPEQFVSNLPLILRPHVNKTEVTVKLSARQIFVSYLSADVHVSHECSYKLHQYFSKLYIYNTINADKSNCYKSIKITDPLSWHSGLLTAIVTIIMFQVIQTFRQLLVYLRNFPMIGRNLSK